MEDNKNISNDSKKSESINNEFDNNNQKRGINNKRD